MTRPAGPPKMSPAERKQRTIEKQDKMKEKMTEHQIKYLEHVPPLYTNKYIRAAAGEGSAKEAIEAMCQHCVGYEAVRYHVANCTSYICPLWAYRKGA